ncbi:MAG: TRAP transporter large permease subunit, partial [Cypionkella sp.]
ILGVNMQTSFMHPPFGFSLFYLRSVAPKEPYTDKVTGKLMAPVKTSQIYWGAVPFVIIQVVMIGLVIGFPQMVMHYKGAVVDTSHVTFTAPNSGLGGLGGLGGLDGGLGSGLGGTATPAAPKTPAPLGNDLLSQPPSFGTTKPAAPAP